MRGKNCQHTTPLVCQGSKHTLKSCNSCTTYILAGSQKMQHFFPFLPSAFQGCADRLNNMQSAVWGRDSTDVILPMMPGGIPCLNLLVGARPWTRARSTSALCTHIHISLVAVHQYPDSENININISPMSDKTVFKPINLSSFPAIMFRTFWKCWHQCN